MVQSHSIDIRFVSIDSYRCQIVTAAAESFLVTRELAEMVAEAAEARSLVVKRSGLFGRKILELAPDNNLGDLLPRSQPMKLAPIVLDARPLAEEDRLWLELQSRLAGFAGSSHTRAVSLANSYRALRRGGR